MLLFLCSVVVISKFVKLDSSRTVILPPTVSVISSIFENQSCSYLAPAVTNIQASTTPFVLTPQQLAQLTQSGIIKVAASPAVSTVTPTRLIAASSPAPLVIKNELTTTANSSYSVPPTSMTYSHGSNDVSVLGSSV